MGARLHLSYANDMLTMANTFLETDINVLKQFEEKIAITEGSAGSTSIEKRSLDVPFLKNLYNFEAKNNARPNYKEILDFSSKIEQGVHYSKEAAFHGILYAANPDEIKLNYNNLVFTFILDSLKKNLVGIEFKKVLHEQLVGIENKKAIKQESTDALVKSSNPTVAYNENAKDELDRIEIESIFYDYEKILSSIDEKRKRYLQRSRKNN